MSRDELNIAIEKNRMALLRLVLAWQFAASVFARHSEKPLPRRVRALVAGLLFKAETAADFLIEAGSYLIEPAKRGERPLLSGRAFAQMAAPLTLKAVAARLNALCVRLENLGVYAKMLAAARRKKRVTLRLREVLRAPCYFSGFDEAVSPQYIVGFSALPQNYAPP